MRGGCYFPQDSLPDFPVAQIRPATPLRRRATPRREPRRPGVPRGFALIQAATPGLPNGETGVGGPTL